MLLLVSLFSLLIAGAGWYYIFYSRAAHRLEGVEAAATNRKRVRLRRLCGISMILLAILFFAGFQSVDAEREPARFLLVWLGVFVLLAIALILAMIDMRLTMQLRNRRRRHD